MRVMPLMIRTTPQSQAAKKTAGIFFCSFLFACFLFWWIPSVLFRLQKADDPITAWTLCISALGIGAFAVGFFPLPVRFRRELSDAVMDNCEKLAWLATTWMSFPAIVVALRFFLYRAGVEYGQGEGLTLVDQAILYSQMFFGFMFLGTARGKNNGRRKVIVVSILVILPRLIISLHWGRFFLAQAIVPILFISLARGWIHLTAKRWIQTAALAIVILFVPALTRGDQFFAQDELIRFFAAGSSLRLFQDNEQLNLAGRCPPLLVSMTAKIFPYAAFGICTVDLWGRTGMPATLDRILAYNDPSTEGTLQGPGANYLLELYLSGGIPVVIAGSLAFGFTNRCFVDWISRRTVFSGIWAECLSRSLFAPRNTLGYVYERIPSLILVTLLVVVVTVAARSRPGLPVTSRGSCLERS